MRLERSAHIRRKRFLTLARLGCIIDLAVGIAQLVEHRTVAPTVAGSIPVSHPRILLCGEPRRAFVSAAQNRRESNFCRLCLSPHVISLPSQVFRTILGTLGSPLCFSFSDLLTGSLLPPRIRTNLPL
jgi:hypothetical protein